MSEQVGDIRPGAAGPPVPSSRCEDEPIQIPGAVQPFGALVAAAWEDGCIHHVSANIARFTGLSPSALLESGAPALIERLGFSSAWAASKDGGIAAARGPRGEALHASWHVWAGNLIVELEDGLPAGARPPLPALEITRLVERLQGTGDLEALQQAAVEEVRAVTGFDRASFYVFDESWHGQVVAESRAARCSSYLDLRFPNSDIPAQARALYARCRRRQVVDAAYTPVPLVTRRRGAPAVDLSLAVTRSISPLHREYMRYLGAKASMSVSLMEGDRLVGLLSCTHEAGAHHVAAANRAVAGLIGSLVSTLAPARRAAKNAALKGDRQRALSGLFERTLDAADFVEVLCGPSPNMLDIVTATGGAILFRGKLVQLGRTPNEQQTRDLIAWVKARHGGVAPFASHTLPADYPPADAFRHLACGTLAVSFPKQPTACVLWFRPEVERTLSWGGDPRQKRDAGAGGGPPRPRRSFERWQEAVLGQCRPWSAADRQSATGLLEVITSGVLQRSEELAALVDELAQSNRELDAFAYAASHDLKEPLRGIHNFVDLALREMDRPGPPPAAMRDRLGVVMAMSQRMEGLINSLLAYAHVGRTEMEVEPFDPAEIMASARQTLETRLAECGAELTVEADMPQMWGDRVLLGEVMTNLISNGLKYNRAAKPQVTVGARAGGGGRTHYFVRDNGIGIAEKHQEVIFTIFRRLHGREKFGGGNGTGLTITKRIIERHGGQMWLESAEGRGTTFFFTLPEGASHGP